MLKSYLILIALAITSVLANADNFSQHFSDSTLRIDYILGGTPSGEKVILLRQQQKFPGWAGRRINLTQVPAHGQGDINVVDPETGDTLYRNSFNTLFQEWLVSEEARTTPRAYEQVSLLPLPRKKALIRVTLYENDLTPMTSSTFTYDSEDVLVKESVGMINEHKYLHKATHENPIDVAILPEGYTIAEKDSFYLHAQTAIDAILSNEPYHSRQDCFNFVAVWLPSAQSGVSVPKNNDWKNTSFNSHFSTLYADRYLTSNNLGAMHDALIGIPYEHIIVLANVEEYGGGGFYNSNALTAARNAKFRPVIVHEFSHSFGALADEYFYDDDMADTYPDNVEPWEANITTLTDFNSKWADMLDGIHTPIITTTKQEDQIPQEIGIFQGAGYRSKGCYRPSDWCMMRSNLYPLCPVCQRAVNKMIDFYIKPAKS